uniref:Uncharacterized protein n=1 Tax=Panagrolaimus davidi TaxID=227884 RepID=A0A914P6J5_9BILA
MVIFFGYVRGKVGDALQSFMELAHLSTFFPLLPETDSGNASTSTDPSNDYPISTRTSTPARRLHSHAHRDSGAHRVDGKRTCHAPITASALHSAVQQTVPQESSSDTPTSTQDRDSSPSIFD